jgi:hypothetical protein
VLVYSKRKGIGKIIQSVIHIALVVKDYDEAIETTILLARASKPEQIPSIGNQAGGRVFLFLGTDDFWRDYKDMLENGIEFVRDPKEQSYMKITPCIKE